MQDFSVEDQFCGFDLNEKLTSNEEIISNLPGATKAAASTLVKYTLSSSEEVDETINVDPVPADEEARQADLVE